MAIVPKQIGWSQEADLYWEVLKELDSINNKICCVFNTTTTTTTIRPIGLGAIYNWYAATDAKKITSSDDWVVPTKTQYEQLVTFLDPDGNFTLGNTAGGNLKETGTVYWDAPNTGATNSAKFNARGSGLRDAYGTGYSSIKLWFQSWSVTPFSASTAYTASTQYTLQSFRVDGIRSKAYGVSIRLLKTTTVLSDGEEGTYVGNDGKIYRTICIGSQEWLADNLYETKFRDGSSITIVTDNAAWMALTSEGMCYYNNDINNA